ncbi:MAG TPA: hypothetical protein VIK33_04920 [Anaerolineae bacterium]
MQLREIGRVARLQIQRTSLKVGRKPYRTYDTSPLADVPQLSMSPEGAVAILPGDETALDVHHLRHPETKHADKNGVSVGFTSNYARMRERFGDHLWDGCAGENILIETSESVRPPDLERGVMIRCGAARAELWLTDVVVALPCVEFSRYSLQMPRAEKTSAEIKEALQFLDGGTRGYYVTPADHGSPLVVSVGDRVFLPE